MKRGFTLTEVLFTVIIISVLATITMASYRQFVDISRQKICEINLKVLEAAVESYAAKNNAFPASPAKLEPEDVAKAYAKVMQDERWFGKFSYFVVKLNKPKNAYAQIQQLPDLMNPDIMQRHGVRREIFTCPADTDGGTSYSINNNLALRAWNTIGADEVLIADSDTTTRTFTEDNFAYRHIRGLGTQRIAQTINRARRVEQHQQDAHPTPH